jgi:hypothetical protein
MKLDLEAIKRRYGAATPGPWKYKWCIDKPKGQFHLYAELGGAPAKTNLDVIKFTGKSIPSLGNAEFIAAAREDVPALVAEVERLRAFLDVAFDVGETNLSREEHERCTMSKPWVDEAREALGEE